MTERAEFARWVKEAVAEHEGPLIGYAAPLVGDVERARDVVQEVFLKLCRQERGAIEGRLAEWLFTVCRNQALDVRRKDGRMMELSEKRSMITPENGRSAAQEVEGKEEGERVMKLVDDLPANQQEVLVLKFQQGMSYKQISAITGLSVSNVGFLIHTAIGKLREKMGREVGIIRK